MVWKLYVGTVPSSLPGTLAVHGALLELVSTLRVAMVAVVGRLIFRVARRSALVGAIFGHRFLQKELRGKRIAIPFPLAHMNTKLIASLLLVFIACARSGAKRDQQQQYETVDEGSASGVTSTIHGPGETLPPITGTNADHTTAFDFDPNAPPSSASTATTATQSGTIAGTMPPIASPPITTTRPPVRVTPPPRPLEPPEQPPPTQTDTQPAPENTDTAEEEPPTTETSATTTTQPPPPPPPA